MPGPKSRTERLLGLYDQYVEQLTKLAQGAPDKDTLEAIRKFLKDEGINAEAADRKDAVENIVSVTTDLPSFDPEEDLV